MTGILLSFSSCNKWLDVSPQTELKETEQFANQDGFIAALFGVYQKAADESLYGGQLTYGLLDVLAQRYESKASVVEYYGQIARYNYTSLTPYPAVATLDNIWSNSYSAIAQCNYILSNIDKRRDVLSAQAYAIIKGEALGMRAFLHFDLMRMYAPAYLDGTNANRLAIPYMEMFQVKPQERLTMSGVFEKCERDLKAAEELLAVYPDIDQISNNQNSTNPDLFLAFRQNHFNYWAAKATLARLYLYKGDKVQALKYAKEVIDGKKFALAGSIKNGDPEAAAADMTFTSEHIFSVYNRNLRTVTDQLFKSVTGASGEEKDLFTTSAKLNLVYESTVSGYSSDIRSAGSVPSMWNIATRVYLKKYHVAANLISVNQSRLPVIRLSEMHYIAAECEPDAQTALAYLNGVRLIRLLPAVTPATPAAFQTEIFKEYRKDFYGEGQLWFYYKRKNSTLIENRPESSAMTEAKYVFPLPLNEIQFGK